MPAVVYTETFEGGGYKILQGTEGSIYLSKSNYDYDQTMTIKAFIVIVTAYYVILYGLYVRSGPQED